MAIFTVVVWGTTFVSTKVLINYGLSPAEILLYRFTLAYVCIWFISPRKLFARSLKEELIFVAAGLSGGSLYFLTENTALGITLASNVSLIISTAPILTAFLSLLFFHKERLTSQLIYGSLIALTGVAFVVFNGSFILKINPLGDLLTLTAALMWAFYGIILRYLNNYPTLFVTRKVFFYGVVTLLPFFIFHPIKFDSEVLLKPVVLANLFFLGVVASMLCYILWTVTIKKLGMLRTTNYIYVIPMVTLLASSLVIHEHITLIALTGSVLILLGVYMAERRSK
mgnify:FL=1